MYPLSTKMATIDIVGRGCFSGRGSGLGWQSETSNTAATVIYNSMMNISTIPLFIMIPIGY